MLINFSPFGKKVNGPIVLNSKKNNIWNINDAQRSLKGDKFSFYLFVSCWIFLIVQLLLIALFWLRLPPQIPIFYSRPWGEAILSTKYAIGIIPAITTGIVIVNLFVSSRFSTNLFLRRIILIFTFLAAFMCFWSVSKIVGLLT